MLAALAHEKRLEAYRLLMEAEPAGLCAGDLAEKLVLPASTMTHHLNTLRGVRLIERRKEQRQQIYRAQVPQMNALVGFLTDRCCGGQPELCCEPQEDTASANGPRWSADKAVSLKH